MLMQQLQHLNNVINSILKIMHYATKDVTKDLSEMKY